MSKPEVLIQAVVIEGLSYGQVAARYSVSKTLIHRLHHRWLTEGDTGLDAGTDTILAHLDRDGRAPPRTTIWRILKRAGTITPQPLKKYLTAHPAATIDELQDVLNEIRSYYNEQRPHRALNTKTPAFAYALIPKAEPTTPDDPNIWRARYDTIDTGGKVSLRCSNRMMHLGVGRTHARTEIIILIHNLDATIISLDGTVLGDYKIDPKQSYQPKTKTAEPQKPGVQPFTMS